MSPEQFQQRIGEMKDQFGELFDRYGLTIVGNVAVSWFKKNFQNQAWGRVKWKEVQRRTPGTKAYKYNAKHHPARTTRRILTGDTGDLGRSIEIREAKNGSVTIWTNPSTFGSKEPYGRVHNEGLRAGRGKGFTMPRRQFMGEDPELDELIIKKLEEKLSQIAQK
ncbi:MAG: phage virion morphogenesis protein [Bacteroidales bacterium]|nr:phage virion morphogenesis protein [Bacteroidales bacterium]